MKPWMETVLYVGTMLIITLCIFLAYAALHGCSAAERLGITQAATKTAVTTAVDVGIERVATKLDHFVNQYTPPGEAVSPWQAALYNVLSIVAAAVMYLSRKKWFPMGKR